MVSEVDVETPHGVVTSVITSRSVKELQLRVGSEVLALVKATDVFIAYDPDKDRTLTLTLIPVPDLFPESTTRLAVRRGTYLRSYAYAFIEKVCPDLGEEHLRAAIQKQNGAE